MQRSDHSYAYHERESGNGSRAFLVALGLVLATATGAMLSAGGTGALQDFAHSIGFGASAEIEAAQRQQADTLDRLGTNLRIVTREMEILKSRVAVARPDPTIASHFTNLDTEVAQLRSEMSGLRSQQNRTVVDLSRADIRIDALRSSISAASGVEREVITDLDKRVERIEHLIGPGEVTGSIAPAPHRRTVHILSGWAVQPSPHGGVAIAGESGTFEVAPGAIVPGLGRVTNVHQRAGRWIVVTDRGVVVQR